MTPKIKQIVGKLDQEINLFEPGQKLIGIDIGSSTVKVVVIKETPIGARLLGIGLSEISAQEKEETKEETKKTISKALKDALSQIKISARNVTTIFSMPSLFIKNINLPAMPLEELKESVKWEMEQNISFPIDTAALDFLVSGETIKSGTKILDIEVVASAAIDIKEHIQIYNENHLSIEAITIPSFCIWNVFQKSNQWKQENTIALIDIGAKNTKINIFSNNILRFNREIPFGGETITNMLAKELGVAVYEAEELKISSGLSETSLHYSKLIEPLKQLAAQIDRSFGYYKAQFHIERIDRVILYGGSAKMINIDKFLSEELSIFVEIGNPLNGLLFEQKAFINLDEFTLYFALAVGAAINSGEVKRINLLPAEFKRENLVEIKKNIFKSIPFLVLIVLGLIYFNIIKEEKMLTKEKTEKEQIINLWKSEQELQRKLDFLSSSKAMQASLLDSLNGISSVIPEGVWIDSISFAESNKTLILKGAGENNILIIDLVRKLESLPYFSWVKLESQEEKGEGLISFIYFKINVKKK